MSMMPSLAEAAAYSPMIADGTLASDNTAQGNNSKRKEKRTKRQYNIRNKNRPKRPLSTYNVFFRHERERLVRESLAEQGVEEAKTRGKTRTGKRVHRKTHGAIGFAELGKHISEAWKSMSEEDKAPFQAEADKDKERYQRELDVSVQSQSQTNQNPGGNKRTSASSSWPTTESRDSSPVHIDDVIEKKLKSSSTYPSDTHDRIYNDNVDTEEGRSYISQHQQMPGYGYQHQPPFSSPAHRAPAHFEYGAHYYPNEHHHRGAPPPAFAPPPHPHGPPRLAHPVYPAHHYPYPGYHQHHHPPNNKDNNESNRINTHHQTHQPTAVAFSPPYPTPQHNRHDYNDPPPHHNKRDTGYHPPSQGNNWTEGTDNPPSPTTEYAFQCEVCNEAVFETFEECADHERACAKAPPPSNRKGKMGDDAEEQQQAVEVVMMLKKPIEC